MRFVGITTVSAGAAHVLAWAAGVWLAFGPVYAGMSVTPVLPGASPVEAVRFSHTLVEVNGLHVILLLLVPVLLTGNALLIVQLFNPGQTRRRILLWVSAGMLVVFCAVGAFSIGMFYLPAALLLLVAAVTGSTGRDTAP